MKETVRTQLERLIQEQKEYQNYERYIHLLVLLHFHTIDMKVKKMLVILNGWQEL